MKLGIISDTHGLIAETRLAVQLFREQSVDTIIHCGDIGSESVVKAFKGIETHFVFGNCDGESDLLRCAARSTGNKLHDWFGTIEKDGKNIAFLHGHQTARFEEEIAGGHWDLICYGHTHSASLQQYGNTLILNPGAFKRVFRPTVAIVTLPELTVEQFDV
ncbi:phosphodiesterase [Planctomycetales bacterium]|nr:phosphodiesterase [Planctomycetales bacterium]